MNLCTQMMKFTSVIDIKSKDIVNTVVKRKKSKLLLGIVRFIKVEELEWMDYVKYVGAIRN